MFKRALLLVLLVLAGIFAFAATRPGAYRVARTTTVAAPAEVVWANLSDFRKWGAWSPWDKLDPKLEKTYEGEPGVVGASYAWKGNKQVGKGRMIITEAQAPTLLALKLEFVEPVPAMADTKFTLAAKSPTATDVTWQMEGTNTLFGKVLGLFMDMDKTIGGDFERGLAGFKAAIEADATNK